MPYRGGRDTGFDKTRELLGVVIGIILLEFCHVVGNMQTEDMLAMNISVELLAVAVEARKATSAKREQQTGEARRSPMMHQSECLVN